MDPLITLPLIAFCCVAVIDVTDIIDSLDGLLSRLIGVKAHVPKPFSCSLCMTHWIGLIWLLCTGSLTLPLYAWLLLLSLLTPVIQDIVRLFIEACSALTNAVARLIETLRFK